MRIPLLIGDIERLLSDRSLPPIDPVARQYMDGYRTIMGDRYKPTLCIDAMPNERAVDWLERTRGFMVRVITVAANKNLTDWDRDHLKLTAEISLEIARLIDAMPRSPVFYINDIVEEVQSDPTQKAKWKTGDAIATTPMRTPFPITLFSYMIGDNIEVLILATNVTFKGDQLTLMLAPYLIKSQPDEERLAVTTPAIMAMPLNEDCIAQDDSKWVCMAFGPSEEDAEKTSIDEATRLSTQLCEPILYVLAMLNCRNAEPERERMHMSRQERRRRERDGLETNDSYRIRISIPKKRPLYYGGSSAHYDESRPLHVVRGHFSHYSEERPLFGKYAGTFWIPAHFRGRGAGDKVLEGYEVVTQQENE